jgi:hypothetical protein
MPPIEDQGRASVTSARTSAFSELDHQLIGQPSPNVGPRPTGRPPSGMSLMHQPEVAAPNFEVKS